VKVDARWSEARMAQAIRREKSGRVRDRMRAILMVMRGEPPSTASVALGHGRDFARRWSERWNAGGYEALLDKPRPGQPKKLATHLEAVLLERLDAGPTEADGVAAFRGEDIRRILSQEFGAEYTVGSTYALMARLGRSYLVPRPRNPRSPDPVEQARFESEAAPLFSSRRRRCTRARG